MWPFTRRPLPEPLPQAAPPPLSQPRRAPVQPGVFTPTQPRHGRAGLVGRTAELARILQALGEDRAHVVVYSERGRGKTSLVNAAVEALRQAGTTVSRYSCEADSRFDDIVRGLVANLPPGVLPDTGDATGAQGLLPPHGIRPDDVAALLPALACRTLVCVVDEFDRVADPATPARMADTIKRLSDRGIRLQFVIVGVSENLEQILGQHPSIQRNIVAVQLPLLSDAETGELIATGMDRAGIALRPEFAARLVLLARGSPHMAQLLGLRLVQAATTRGDATLAEPDFAAALDLLLREAAPSDVMLWDGLTANSRSEDMVTALRRLAAADQDRWGRIEAVALPDGGVMVGGRPIAAPLWDRISQADLLRAVPAGSGLYVFRQRSAMHYILMLATRTLSEPQLPAPMRLVATSSP